MNRLLICLLIYMAASLVLSPLIGRYIAHNSQPDEEGLV